MVVKRIVAALASAALVMVLCPTAALAGPLGAAEMSGAKAAAVATQAKKTEPVYVISRITESSSSNPGGVPTVHTLSYGKTGLLAKKTSKRGDAETAVKWTYKSNDLRSVRTPETQITFTVDKSGRKVLGKWKAPSYKASATEKYTYSSGRISKLELTERFSGGYVDEHSYAYTYRNGLVRTAKAYLSGQLFNTTTFVYDKKGNLKLEKSSGSGATKYENEYDGDGRLAKRSDSASVNTYAYKVVQVPSALVPKVKAQQWAIVNRNLNYAVGGSLLSF